MGKSLFGAVIGALIGIIAGAWFVEWQLEGSRGWPQGELWPQVAQAQLVLAKPLDKDGLPTLVALATELQALRRERSMHRLFNARHWFRTLAPSSQDDSEDRALDFMIDKVTATVASELDQWQNKMTRINELDPLARGAALRLLGFVKWQQKGGEYEYAYDFFEQLRQAAIPPPPLKEVTATASEETNSWPLQGAPKRRKAPR